LGKKSAKKNLMFLLKFLQNQLHKNKKELFLMTKFKPNLKRAKNGQIFEISQGDCCSLATFQLLIFSS
jgi:hypothetical protein